MLLNYNCTVFCNGFASLYFQCCSTASSLFRLHVSDIIIDIRCKLRLKLNLLSKLFLGFATRAETEPFKETSFTKARRITQLKVRAGCRKWGL